MGTFGLVTIKDEDTVLMKIVASCNGRQAKKAARVFYNKYLVNLMDVFNRDQALLNQILAVGFGCPNCLVIQSFMSTWQHEDAEERTDEVIERYHSTFQDPNFNPVWSPGTSDYKIILDISRIK